MLHPIQKQIDFENRSRKRGGKCKRFVLCNMATMETKEVTINDIVKKYGISKGSAYNRLYYGSFDGWYAIEK